MLYLLILILGSASYDFDFWVNTCCSLVPVIIFFYVNTSFLLPRYLSRGKIIPLIAWLVLFNFLAICLRLVLVMLVQQKGFGNWLEMMLTPTMFWNQFRVNMLFIGISFAYWYAQRNYKIEKDRQRLEREVLSARLSSLENQINPHFLHNTLSFLYGRSLPYSAQLADAIIRLSDMMRYSLGETGEDGKISLEKEVAHLQNFIKIHQLRFDDKLNVNFTIQGDYSQQRIMPLLLITFVENAFKHGILNDAGYPLSIRLCVNKMDIDFAIQNKKNTGVKEKSSGIGLQNVRNRLELAYPGHHAFTIEDKPDEFIVKLKLTLLS
jgi:two-component system, LytTR family, sensor kinase